jgi:hypothetical protein
MQHAAASRKPDQRRWLAIDGAYGGARFGNLNRADTGTVAAMKRARPIRRLACGNAVVPGSDGRAGAALTTPR